MQGFGSRRRSCRTLCCAFLRSRRPCRFTFLRSCRAFGFSFGLPATTLSFSVLTVYPAANLVDQTLPITNLTLSFDCVGTSSFTFCPLCATNTSAILTVYALLHFRYYTSLVPHVPPRFLSISTPRSPPSSRSRSPVRSIRKLTHSGKLSVDSSQRPACLVLRP
jgi:hypothetical protein